MISPSDPVWPVEEWSVVTCDGVDWLVAPDVIAPVAIGQAADIAKASGCELPSPRLVDAIWKAADLKIDPRDPTCQLTRIPTTPSNMTSPAAYANQAMRVAAAIAGRAFVLVSGTHKDVVSKDGVIGLYGWVQKNGVPIQPFFAGHALSYCDYSQSVRLCRRVASSMSPR